MTARILIVGAGGIGARHLQSLARVVKPLQVDVVDPSEAARCAAAAQLAEVGGLKCGEARYHADLSAISTPDIAIVATNSRERARVVIDLAHLGVKRFILEKVLFTRLADYDLVAQALAQHGISAWVNCARRANPRANELRSWIQGPIDYRVKGTGWGLACNAVHHLDELSFLSGSAICEIDSTGLDPGSIPAKRNGYRELTGTLRARTERGDTFEAICDAGESGDRIVTITDHNRSYAISQFMHDMHIRDADGERREPYPIAFQSEATARHVADIVAGRAPALPGWKDASRTHRVMIAAFLDHMRKTDAMTDPDECPVT